MKQYKTEQEAFWAGEFGNDYIDRNKDAKIIASNISLFSKIINSSNKIESVFELGSNIGLNLVAIKSLLPSANLYGLEINKQAYEKLNGIKYVNAFNDSILNFDKNFKADLVFTKGVLIHINPEELNKVYEKIYEFSNKYICIIEYYNPVPVSIDYRGHKNKLFKRDFAGELLDKFKDLKLLNYGFVYHRDNNFKQDDANWFLLEK